MEIPLGMERILEQLNAVKVSPFAGVEFWVAALGACILFAAVARLTRRADLRSAILSFLSLGVIFAALDGNRGAAVLLILGLTVGVFCLGLLLCRHREQSPGGSLAAAVLLLLAVLGYFKYEAVRSVLLALWPSGGSDGGPGTAMRLLGVSYFTFKYIHYLVDCRSGKVSVDGRDFPAFLGYILFLPSFFSGPINRFQPFREDVNSGGVPKWGDFRAGSRRIVDGLFKKIVLASSLAPYAISSMDLGDPGLSRWAVLAGIYAYGLYVYFDFSGYTDIAIGLARFMGIRLPENFNYPFFRRNIQEFWANWHISLTTWLTDYIYWPTVRKLRDVTRFRKNPVETSVISIVLTFLLSGVWHGDGWNFVLWGLYHGFGLGMLNVYRKVVNSYAGMDTRKWIAKSRVSYAASSFLTFNYVSIGFLLFACDLAKIRQVLSLWV
jgi:alginate O-acetyltransferase complex protein AlgI